MIYRRLLIAAVLAGLAAAGCDDANKGNATVAPPGEQKRGNKAGGGTLPKPPPVEKVGP